VHGGAQHITRGQRWHVQQVLNLGPVRALASSWRAKENENVARPVAAKLFFDFLDFLLVAFGTKEIVRLFLLLLLL
jgi:hypothetical protein